MFDRVEIRRIGGHEDQAHAALPGQFPRIGGVVGACIVEHHMTASGQFRQEHLFKIRIHQGAGACAVKNHRGNQFAVLPRPDDAGALAHLSAYWLVKLFAPGRPSFLPINPVVNSAFVQVIHPVRIELLELAFEQPAFQFVSFPVFCEFFLK